LGQGLRKHSKKNKIGCLILEEVGNLRIFSRIYWGRGWTKKRKFMIVLPLIDSFFFLFFFGDVWSKGTLEAFQDPPSESWIFITLVVEGVLDGP
jgi:hypothetical protein